jgi:hypothetical protein
MYKFWDDKDIGPWRIVCEEVSKIHLDVICVQQLTLILYLSVVSPEVS